MKTDLLAPIRVFQVATGNVGTEMIRRIGRHRDLELVGVHCYTLEKAGRDVGELAGTDPIDLKATGTVEEIVAAKPDVVTFHGVFPDETLYLRVLEAGIDIVATADWITGHHRDTNHPHPSGRPWTEILGEACRRGGASFYGTGMNPGLCQVLGVVHSCDVAEIENVTVIESVDVSCHHSATTWREVGYGRPVDDPALPAMLEKYTSVFADSVRMMADCFHLELDEVRFFYEMGACTKPRWDIRGRYITRIQGDLCVHSKHQILPKPGTDFSSADAFASIGMTVTGLPALNAIRAVVAAPPGILTSADLPLRGFAGRFKR